MPTSPAMELFVRYLERRDRVSPAEVERLHALQLRPATYDRGAEIIAESSEPEMSCLMQSGLSARAVARANGKRQLTALHIPGDFVDLHGLTLKRMDHSVIALTTADVVFVRHTELARITEALPHLTRLLWLSTTIDAAIQRRMTALVGRHTPMERLCHLLCEICTRMETVGLATKAEFEFPITQTELADLLGLSLVHTNRTVQDVRATGLVLWDGQTVQIPSFEKLARFASFDDTYLNLFHKPR